MLSLSVCGWVHVWLEALVVMETCEYGAITTLNPLILLLDLARINLPTVRWGWG